MVVEDEGAILKLAERMLNSLNYDVLIASSPVEALSLSEMHEGTIDLLITDVIMPEMNGRELSERVMTRRPGMKCLFMSGYTADAIAQHGVLKAGMNFLQKPFSKQDFSMKVRAILQG
ncbi:response regulator [Desulforhopalus sp. IMCC35007]|uniref:response regulator n=1 Tax=Desulforhopalus sp. IMCC35007 TaxID=2569543 RepID=UPI0021104FF2|nr:response regulator [Desulforhopalus sp. IMCC35007]